MDGTDAAMIGSPHSGDGNVGDTRGIASSQSGSVGKPLASRSPVPSPALPSRQLIDPNFLSRLTRPQSAGGSLSGSRKASPALTAFRNVSEVGDISALTAQGGARRAWPTTPPAARAVEAPPSATSVDACTAISQRFERRVTEQGELFRELLRDVEARVAARVEATSAQMTELLNHVSNVGPSLSTRTMALEKSLAELRGGLVATEKQHEATFQATAPKSSRQPRLEETDGEAIPALAGAEDIRSKPLAGDVLAALDSKLAGIDERVAIIESTVVERSRTDDEIRQLDTRLEAMEAGGGTTRLAFHDQQQSDFVANSAECYAKLTAFQDNFQALVEQVNGERVLAAQAAVAIATMESRQDVFQQRADALQQEAIARDASHAELERRLDEMVRRMASTENRLDDYAEARSKCDGPVEANLSRGVGQVVCDSHRGSTTHPRDQELHLTAQADRVDLGDGATAPEVKTELGVDRRLDHVEALLAVIDSRTDGIEDHACQLWELESRLTALGVSIKHAERDLHETRRSSKVQAEGLLASMHVANLSTMSPPSRSELARHHITKLSDLCQYTETAGKLAEAVQARWKKASPKVGKLSDLCLYAGAVGKLQNKVQDRWSKSQMYLKLDSTSSKLCGFGERLAEVEKQIVDLRALVAGINDEGRPSPVAGQGQKKKSEHLQTVVAGISEAQATTEARLAHIEQEVFVVSALYTEWKAKFEKFELEARS